MNDSNYRSIAMSSFADELSKEAVLGSLVKLLDKAKKAISPKAKKLISPKNFKFNKEKALALQNARHSTNPLAYKNKQLTSATRHVR